MSFKNPYFLLLFLPLLFFSIYVGKNYYSRFFKTNFPLDLPLNYNFKIFLIENFGFYARVLILSLTIIALARPQKITRGEIPPTYGVDILLVIDTSLSMQAPDLLPTRLEAAKQNAKEFVIKRKNDRIGIVVFGGVAYLSCPLTLDHDAVIRFIDQIQPGMTKSDGTAIGDAILVATNHLKNSKAKSKIMILLTDGRSNTGVVGDPITAAKLTSQFEIKIYTIGTAKKGPSKIPTQNPLQPYIIIEDDLNEDELKKIADITGGNFYRATSSEELNKIYSDIDNLEKTKFEIKYNIEVTELYNRFLIPALIIAALTLIIEKNYIMSIP